MFTPDQERAAAEMLRVCRPGGRIGLANWTPEGFIGQMFKTLGSHRPPPAGVRSPILWGSHARIDELFGADASSIRIEQRHYSFRYRSAEHWVEVFRRWYGPVLKAFAALEPPGQDALNRDLMALVAHWNRSHDDTLVVPAEYLEVVITRK